MEKETIQYDAEKYPNFKEYLWFEEHEEELMRRYYGRYLVIKDGQVIGDYGTRKLARQETVKNHQPGTFIIHQCVKKEPIKMPGLIGRKIVTVDGK